MNDSIKTNRKTKTHEENTKKKNIRVVDHIVPLNGYSVELGQYSVCGLHVENNLRIISNKENSSKNNLFEPCSDAELPPCEIELDLSLLD